MPAFVVLLMFIDVSFGFTVNSHSSSLKTKSVLSTQQYDFLRQFVFMESQSRLQLEKIVEQLQSDLETHKLAYNNLVSEISFLKSCKCLKGNPVVKTDDGEVPTDCEKVKFENIQLQKETIKLNKENIQLNAELVETKNKSLILEKELTDLMNQKISSRVETINRLNNNTNMLMEDVKTLKKENELRIKSSGETDRNIVLLSTQLNKTVADLTTSLRDAFTLINSSSMAVSDILTTQNDIKEMEAINRKQTEMTSEFVNKEQEINLISRQQDSTRVDLAAIWSQLNVSSRAIQRLSEEKPVFGASLTYKKSYSENEIVKFDKVWTNTGNGYNPNTGKFTAAASGSYYFSCTIMKFRGPVRVFLMHNTQRTISIYPGGNSYHEGGTLNMALVLSKGDQVYIQVHLTPHLIYTESRSHMTYFSGFML